MEITLPIYLTGLLSSIVIEIIKFFPKVGESDFLKSLVAVIVVALGAFFTIGWSWENFFSVMLFAFANYKCLVQPIAKATALPSQTE